MRTLPIHVLNDRLRRRLRHDGTAVPGNVAGGVSSPTLWELTMRTLGVTLFAALLAGCSALPPPGIQVTIPAKQDVRALPVTVVDNTGIVLEVSPAAIPAGFNGVTRVEVVAGRDDAVVLAWTGGACDDRAIVRIDRAGNRYQAKVESQTSPLGCTAVGIFRAVLLSLTGPVGPDDFEAS
jgi:hypothetical protein